MWIPYFLSSSSVSFFGSGTGIAKDAMSVIDPENSERETLCREMDGGIRRFLFQTAFGSGAAAGRPPFMPNLGIESLLPVPVFAMSRGLVADRLKVEACVTRLAIVEGFSPTLGTEGIDTPFVARKVLLTETALKVAGFLAEDVLL
jgi:hypothetical protein